MTKINNCNQILADITFESLFLSQKGICIAQNETAKTMFGYSDEEAIGESGLNWIHPMDRELVSNKMKENVASAYEVLALRKDGSTFPCEIQAKTVEFEGQLIRVTALRDISTRKTIEKELFDKITEIDIITASIPNAIWKAKFDDNGVATNVYISDSVNSLLELPAGTIKTTDWDKYFSYVMEGEKDKAYEKIGYAIQNPGKTITHVYQIKKGNGEISWMSSIGYAVVNNGETVIYGFTYDVTELKKSEQALKELNTAKDKLFSIISHDLKNPFTALLGFSELMLRQIESGKAENLKKYAEAILHGARQGSELLSNLLDWSRTQRKKVTFNPEMIDMHSLIQVIQNYFDQPIKNKEIKLSYVNEGVGGFIGDRMMLETILRNLVSNAIKFVKRKGNIEIHISADKKNINFCVKDDGVGISEENQKNLFNINSTRTSYGTENEKGTGLGLVLCKEFVDFHNGEISVESQENKGTKFWFSIPKK